MGRNEPASHKALILPVALAAAALTSAATSLQPASADTRVDGTCFGNRIEHVSGAQIARNTVFIAGVRADGTLTSSAAGFVVRGRHGLRIVTALHVVDPNAGETGSTPMVFFSDGAPLGVPQVVAATAPRKETFSSVELTVDDLAVLEIARFADPAALRRLSELDGLQVAAGGSLMVGETDGATAVAWGYSGSAAVDQSGRVVGVLTSADFRGRVSVNLASIQEAKRGERRHDTAVTLPDRSLVIVEPFEDPAIVHQLQLTEATTDDGRTSKVVFAGFPSASCASTSALLRPATVPAGAALLRKWGDMDQLDAWWMPPGFSIKTVDFSYR